MEERRQDDKTLAVFIQRFNDFLENTEKYRKAQEDAQSRIFSKLEKITDFMAKLPCDSRQVRWDSKIKNIDDDSRNQWVVIGAIWTVIGACAYSIFEAWVRLWNGK